MADRFGFPECFKALTGHARLRWQERLFNDLVQGKIQPIVDLPTGLGKTSVIPIWLIALVRPGVPVLPRRLVYIVNRRTVVDQATDVVERMRERLLTPNHSDWEESADVLRYVAERLRRLAAIPCEPLPLAVSTLRGELADNGEWKVDPARPAIIIGTIDMIGSKLLFSGYGDGRYGRAHHAGLIGQDALIVHDEAHLSPAFSALLRSIEAEQSRCGESRPIHVMHLSATSRAKVNGDTDGGHGFRIEDEDRDDPVVRQRLLAVKRLRFRDADKSKLEESIVEDATKLGKSPCRVLVYVRSPDAAAKIVQALRKKLGADAKDHVGLLTGTIRGFERDQLARSSLFEAFRSGPNRVTLSHTLYLVSTSAGEVGVDLDADHLVCDLTTLESMAQRFGRVNRLGGEGRSAQIVVVREKAGESAAMKKGKKPTTLDDAIAKTGAVFDRVVSNYKGDVSPGALKTVLESDEAQAAFSPPPTILPATDILFDHWSLTSIAGELPGRPQVGPYLHGVAEWDPPETHVAWRAEIAELAKAGVSDDDLEEILDVFPLRTVERLRDRSDRVLDQLKAISERHADAKAVFIKSNSVRWVILSALAPADKNKRDAAIARLAFATILLPAEVGGLKDGCLDGGVELPATDVAESPVDGLVDRQRVWVEDEAERPVMGGEPIDEPVRFWLRWGDSEASGEDGPAPKTLEFRVATKDSGEPGQRVDLGSHNTHVGTAAQRTAEALSVSPDLCSALALAGQRHDTGKARDVWQRYARNTGQPTPLAKATRYLHWTRLGGYRHEFGSLLDALGDADISRHPERDLILHLIAAHHGWARPHFEPKHFDPLPRTTAANVAAATEAMQRFARLQQRFGRWGLAWLESLVRCADAMASQTRESTSGRAGAGM